jgi:colicin import membrane protein
MTAAMAAQAFSFPQRREPAFVRSFALAFAVHAILLGVMFLGVRLQSSRPETIAVELWEAPALPPAPVLEAPKPPPPQAEPEQPVAKPDIVTAEKPKPKAKPKPEPKRDREFEKRLREQVAMEQKAVENQRRASDEQRKERELRDLIARQQADARAKALAAWQEKIRAKIRGNIILPRDLAGNPEAVFDVALLPTGEVLSVKPRKSSGHPGYDEAVHRAILKSSPLPKPENPSLFDRQLELHFRPQDK